MPCCDLHRLIYLTHLLLCRDMPELKALVPKEEGVEPGLFGYRYFWFLIIASFALMAVFAWKIRMFDIMS